MTIQIPAKLAINHGNADAAALGSKFAETFDMWGGLRAGDWILDIGCGPGRMAIGIGDRFGWQNHYLGFDIQEPDINFCKANIEAQHPSFRFRHINLYNSHYNKNGTVSPESLRFPAKDKSIDFVFATSVYTHLDHKDSAHYLKETGRVCRRRTLSTWFILDDNFEAAKAAGKARYDFPFLGEGETCYQRENNPLDIVGHSINSIKRMHEAAGLRIVEIYAGEWTRRAKGRHSQDVVVAEPV